MGKKVVILLVLLIIVFICYHETKTHDLKNAFSYVVEKLKEKKPESETEEMVSYLKEKAKKDTELNSDDVLKSAIRYIKNNIDSATSNEKKENLIYYGYILQYSPKSSDMGLCTTIGIKTVEAVKEVYIKNNDYKKAKKNINKTNIQIIKALINRLDMN